MQCAPPKSSGVQWNLSQVIGTAPLVRASRSTSIGARKDPGARGRYRGRTRQPFPQSVPFFCLTVLRGQRPYRGSVLLPGSRRTVPQQQTTLLFSMVLERNAPGKHGENVQSSEPNLLSGQTPTIGPVTDFFPTVATFPGGPISLLQYTSSTIYRSYATISPTVSSSATVSRTRVGTGTGPRVTSMMRVTSATDHPSRCKHNLCYLWPLLSQPLLHPPTVWKP